LYEKKSESVAMDCRDLKVGEDDWFGGGIDENPRSWWFTIRERYIFFQSNKGKSRWDGKETKGSKKGNENVFNILP
jgi:hypothetical protein